MSAQDRPDDVTASEPAALLPPETGAAPPPKPDDAQWTPMMFGAVFLAVFACASLAMLSFNRYSQNRTVAPPPRPPVDPALARLPASELVVPPSRSDPRYVEDDDAWESISKMMQGKGAGGQAPPKPQPVPAVPNRQPAATPGDKFAAIIKALYGDDTEKRRQALFDLTLTEPYKDARRGQVVKALIDLAQSPTNRFDPQDVQNALIIWADKDDIGTLVALLKDPREEVRALGMKVLGELKDRRAAEPLAQMLESNNDRPKASSALKAIGKDAELSVRVRLANPNPRVRQEACEILGDIGTRTSLPQLQATGADPDGFVRNAAGQAIKQILSR